MIDTTKIENYDTMSPEEKVKALEAYEFNVPKTTADEDVEKLKKALSKVNSEAADYKRQLREKQTESERLEAERLEESKKKDAELEMYRRATAVSESKAYYLSLGYDDALATATAEAEADGDKAKVRANGLAFQQSYRERVQAELLNNQPKPTVGKTPSGINLMDLSDDEYYKAISQK